MSLATEYLAWRRLPAVGCVFARLVAVHPANYDQVIEVEPSDAAPDLVAGLVAGRIDRLVSDAGVSAGVILLPGLDTMEKITRMSLALDGKLHWHVTTTALQNPPNGPMVAMHITRDIPFGDQSRPSEVLFLGPFPEFPATRRAPLTALEMYVGVPRQTDPKTGQPTAKANLAHLPLNIPTQTAFDTTWDNSVKGRLLSLGGTEDSRAKAKVSFAIPLALAEAVGCAP